jgi:hypothetical protein
MDQSIFYLDLLKNLILNDNNTNVEKAQKIMMLLFQILDQYIVQLKEKQAEFGPGGLMQLQSKFHQLNLEKIVYSFYLKIDYLQNYESNFQQEIQYSMLSNSSRAIYEQHQQFNEVYMLSKYDFSLYYQLTLIVVEMYVFVNKYESIEG